MAASVLLALDRLALRAVAERLQGYGVLAVPMNVHPGITAREIVASAAESGAVALVLDASLPVEGGARAARAGLRLLEDIVLEGQHPGSVVVISPEPLEQLRTALTSSLLDGKPAILPPGMLGIEFLRLPASDSSWRKAIARSTKADRLRRVKPALQEAQTRLVLVRKAAEDGAFRHRLRNYAAAVRLLQGAMYGGCISADTYWKALATLTRQADGDNFQELQAIADEEQRALARYAEHYSVELPLDHRLRQRVLLIDDQAVSAGWQLVMRQVVGRRLGLGVQSCESVDEGLRQARKRDDVAAILLDYHFGEERVSTTTVAALREAQRGVPIIMFTARNDAHTAARFYDTGVTRYFVKDRDEDRAPLAYFDDFVGTIDVAARVARRRALYRAVSVLAGDGQSADRVDETTRSFIESAIDHVGPEPSLDSILATGRAFERIFRRIAAGKGLRLGAHPGMQDLIRCVLFHLVQPKPPTLDLAVQMRNMAAHGEIDEKSLCCVDNDIYLWVLFATIRRFCVGNPTMPYEKADVLEGAGQTYLRCLAWALNRHSIVGDASITGKAAELGIAVAALLDAPGDQRVGHVSKMHRRISQARREKTATERDKLRSRLYPPGLARELAEAGRLPEMQVLASLLAVRWLGMDI